MLLSQGQRPRGAPAIVGHVTLGVIVAWVVLVASLGWWLSQRAVIAELDDLASSAEYEAGTTARVVDRLFTEMVSVANMVARQGQIIQLATRYRVDPPSRHGAHWRKPIRVGFETHTATTKATLRSAAIVRYSPPAPQARTRPG